MSLEYFTYIKNKLKSKDLNLTDPRIRFSFLKKQKLHELFPEHNICSIVCQIEPKPISDTVR